MNDKPEFPTPSALYPAQIATALHAVMAAVSFVHKSGTNDFHKYKYAGEADFLRAVRPAMIEHGLMLIPSVEEITGPDDNGNTTVKVAYTLLHKSGEVWPEKIYGAGCGNDRNTKGGIGDKGIYKAITGANKYALYKLFQIETGDDPEKESVADEAAKPDHPHSVTAIGVFEAAMQLCFSEADLKEYFNLNKAEISEATKKAPLRAETFRTFYKAKLAELQREAEAHKLLERWSDAIKAADKAERARLLDIEINPARDARKITAEQYEVVMGWIQS
jgi:hypothetical protein